MIKTIKKRETLKGTLSEMQIGDEVIIKPAAHSTVYVRQSVHEPLGQLIKKRNF